MLVRGETWSKIHLDMLSGTAYRRVPPDDLDDVVSRMLREYRMLCRCAKPLLDNGVDPSALTRSSFVPDAYTISRLSLLVKTHKTPLLFATCMPAHCPRSVACPALSVPNWRLHSPITRTFSAIPTISRHVWLGFPSRRVRS